MPQAGRFCLSCRCARHSLSASRLSRSHEVSVMPPKKVTKGPDSRQGLIIGLVCFVLLALILGVTTYTGYAEAARLDGLLKTADADKKKADSTREWYKFQALSLKAYAGHASKDDLNDLAALRTQYGDGGSGTLGQGEKDRAEMDKLVAQLD